MPEKRPEREDMRRAEKEIGENMPDAAIGLDNADVGDVVRHDKERDAPKR